jgi:hypothetical protein
MNLRGILLRKWAIDTPLLQKPEEKRQHHDHQDVPQLPLRVIGKKRVRPCDTHNDWPARTDVWCWYCCHPFDTQPLPMPIKYDDRRDIFHVMGTFCSWPCMKAANSESNSVLKNVDAMNITLFYKRCTGKLGRVRPAPPRVTLRAFGGTMTIEEFRRASDNEVLYRVLPAKMIVHHAAIEETSTKAKHKPCNLGETVNFKDVSAKNETLRLKRPKPLQGSKNTLERAMGINALMMAGAS